MASIVFDIETTALALENFDEAQQEYLFSEAEKVADEAALSPMGAFEKVKILASRITI